MTPLNVIGRLEPVTTCKWRGIPFLSEALDATYLIEEMQHARVFVRLIIEDVKAVSKLIV